MIGLSCLLLATAGCANFWDELLSQERDWTYVWSYHKPDPMTVILANLDGKPNADGLRRSQALSELGEPLQHGGNATDQERRLEILTTSATKYSEPLCRLAAIRALGKYHDPRAARALEQVHQ